MNYIKIFQEKNNLEADGIIGRNTLLKMKEIFELKSDENTAHFIGQLDHETAGFKYDKENLNYSVKGLVKIFSKYFPTEKATKGYARDPEKIANKVYANRMGNGPENSGDGWKYKGRGSVQLTGRDNYAAFAYYIGDASILDNPEKILPDHYWNVALFFFRKNGIFNSTRTVNYNSIRKVTKRINGGYNGLQHRFDNTIKYYKILSKKEKQNERQDINSTDSNVINNSGSVLDSKKLSTEKGVPSQPEDKNIGNSKRLFNSFIRRVLPKTSR